jgi:hypothetical protein
MKKEAATETSAVKSAPAASTKLTLVEGVDYYFEENLMVFTAHFLLRRGYCCENGCRHCPYDKEANE